MLLNMFAMGHGLHSRVRQKVFGERLTNRKIGNEENKQIAAIGHVWAR